MPSSRKPGLRQSALAVVMDPHSPLNLQHQLRQRLVDAMNRGLLRPGSRLPSSRQLAEQVGVSRNTVTLAYDALLAEGHLVSRPRSGIFVADGMQGERVTTGRRGLGRAVSGSARFAGVGATGDWFRRPPNWDQYPYPFLDGCIDASLAPVEEWREALRLAFAKQAIVRWSTSDGEHDDPLFIEELRGKWLPSWGIDAAPDEIVATSSLRHALYLATEALVQRSTPVLLADGIDQDVRRRLLERQAQVLSLAAGADVVSAVEQCAPGSVIVLAAHRSAGIDAAARERASAVLLAAASRDSIIIEFTAAPELRESRRAMLSLRALDTSGRVVFVSGLSAVAAIGTAPGFINADARLTERIRQLRRMMGSELPSGLQRAWSYFIGLGHYTACMARANRALSIRRTALRDALNHYLHKFVAIESVFGHSAYRVRGPTGMNSVELARAALALGVLIEPAQDGEAANVFYMGVTSLPKEHIRAGVELLSRLIRGGDRPGLGSGAGSLQATPARILGNKALRRAMSGTTLLYNTVYGEPCTIEVRVDGTLVGRAGYANEDCDTGRWWIEGQRWCRQWENWAYGEPAGYATAIEGDQVRWFNADGLLVDTALIVRGKRRRAHDSAI